MIAQTIQSAIAQTWPRKEIIVVDDSSRDRTADEARRFASKEVAVVTVENGGAAAARNHALKLSQGDYIQFLDADDLLGPDKIASQLAALRDGDDQRTLLSGAWGYFHYRPQRARFLATPLWEDLSPVEWLLRKMGQNLHMQTATWLTSRELADKAGRWDTRLLSDDDGEYFCRALLASTGTRFVPEARVFYRLSATSRLSQIGTSNRKKDAMLVSMKLHLEYLRSLEESERVREVCLAYMQNWFDNFYPERPDIVAELRSLATQFQGTLEKPRLRWKYGWMEPIVGYETAKRAQMVLPEFKASLVRKWDQTMYGLEKRNAVVRPAADAADLVRSNSNGTA
jgi:glycosyltransferase involved in cell wall biosynthesis